MTNFNFKYLSILFFTTFLFSCIEKEIPYNYENLIKKGDSIVNVFDKNNVKVYAEITKNKYEKIIDIDNWDKDYLSIVNLFETKDVKVYKIIIEPESGDYYCVNNLYYDNQNKLKVLISDVSYFNSICSKGILTKKSTYYYKNKKEISKRVLFFDEKHEQVKDTTNCINDYSCAVGLFFDYKNIPIYKTSD